MRFSWVRVAASHCQGSSSSQNAWFQAASSVARGSLAEAAVALLLRPVTVTVAHPAAGSAGSQSHEGHSRRGYDLLRHRKSQSFLSRAYGSLYTLAAHWRYA